jgi:hypothetical protein
MWTNQLIPQIWISAERQPIRSILFRELHGHNVRVKVKKVVWVKVNMKVKVGVGGRA